MLDVALAMSGSFKPAPDDLLPGLTLSLTLAIFGTSQARRRLCDGSGSPYRRW